MIPGSENRIALLAIDKSLIERLLITQCKMPGDVELVEVVENDKSIHNIDSVWLKLRSTAFDVLKSGEFIPVLDNSNPWSGKR